MAQQRRRTSSRTVRRGRGEKASVARGARAAVGHYSDEDPGPIGRAGSRSRRRSVELRRRRAPRSATKPCSPRPLRTVLDDVRHRCCATDDARPAHDRPRVETGRFKLRHGHDREAARLALFAFMTTHRGRASTSHERCRRTRSRVDAARGRRSSRRSKVESRDAYGVERGARHGSGSSPVAQQRCRTSCEDRAKRPREKTSSRETASSDRRPLCS